MLERVLKIKEIRHTETKIPQPSPARAAAPCTQRILKHQAQKNSAMVQRMANKTDAVGRSPDFSQRSKRSLDGI